MEREGGGGRNLGLKREVEKEKGNEGGFTKRRKKRGGGEGE
jgi:hypothetical protein